MNRIFGVVSAAELIGILIFVVFVVWAIIAAVFLDYSEVYDYDDITEAEVPFYMVRMTARSFGVIAFSCMSFLFLPVSRGSIFLRLTNIPVEQAIRYHVWVGNLTMVLLTLHGFTYMTEWVVTGIFVEDFFEWRSDSGANLAGILCYGFGVAMWVTSITIIRRKYSFEVFYYTHHLYVLFVIFMAMHVGDTAFSRVIAGIFIFMVDRFLRFCQSRNTVLISSVTCFPCGAVKLVLPKPPNLEYNALSFLFLQVKGISRLQWHPFSVSSSPLEDKHHLSVLIKAAGDWTESLRQKLLQHCKYSVTHHDSMITASVEGPYGHESPYHLTYENLVLVAGGSGISPFIAILSDILHRIREKRPCKPRNVLLIWSVRKSNELFVLRSANLESICPNFRDTLNLEIEAYVTRESQPPLENHIPELKGSDIQDEGSSRGEQVICSWAPNPASDKISNMSGLVGTGNKIWSGMYLIVSTVGFVVCWVVMNEVYINPLDVTFLWYRSLLLLICMVFGILIFGGVVVALWHLWDIRSSRLAYCQGNPSLESHCRPVSVVHHDLPNGDDAFSTSINIRYGSRPDIADIFGCVAERWGHVDAGVVVCGPQSLKVSVAQECRWQNLRAIEGAQKHPIFHFNSHSFEV